MIYGISIYGKNVDYATIVKTLDQYELEEITFAANKDLVRYAKSKDIVTQEFPIEWGNVVGADPAHIVEGKFGPYNKNAPKEAAEKVVNYADKIIIVGEGDGNLNSLAKTQKKEIVNDKAKEVKRYKF